MPSAQTRETWAFSGRTEASADEKKVDPTTGEAAAHAPRRKATAISLTPSENPLKTLGDPCDNPWTSFEHPWKSFEHPRISFEHLRQSFEHPGKSFANPWKLFKNPWPPFEDPWKPFDVPWKRFENPWKEHRNRGNPRAFLPPGLRATMDKRKYEPMNHKSGHSAS